MKKLMMAFAIVCATAFTQAGTVSWSSSYLNVAGQSGDEADVVDGATVYLMAGNSSALFASLVADFDTTVAGAVNSAIQGEDYLASPAVGSVSGVNVNFEASAGTVDYFMVMKDGDNIYISETVTANIPSVGGELAMFTHDAAYNGDYFKSGEGFQGAGWYNTAAIPEPTSGLLLLLGMAGLALKRKQA